MPIGSSIIPGTLRAQLEELRAQGAQLSLTEAVGIVVPLAVEIAKRHEAGELLYVHPSSIAVDETGVYHLSPELAAKPPALPRDKVCMAPEERAGGAGNARASVFALGAVLYELVSSEVVGPGMRRPTELQARTLISLIRIGACALDMYQPIFVPIPWPITLRAYWTVDIPSRWRSLVTAMSRSRIVSPKDWLQNLTTIKIFVDWTTKRLRILSTTIRLISWWPCPDIQTVIV